MVPLVLLLHGCASHFTVERSRASPTPRLQVLLVCPGAASLEDEMAALKDVHGAVTASARPHAVLFATQRVRPQARPLRVTA